MKNNNDNHSTILGKVSIRDYASVLLNSYIETAISEFSSKASNEHIWAMGSKTQEEALERESLSDDYREVAKLLEEVKNLLYSTYNFSVIIDREGGVCKVNGITRSCADPNVTLEGQALLAIADQLGFDAGLLYEAFLEEF